MGKIRKANAAPSTINESNQQPLKKARKSSPLPHKKQRQKQKQEQETKQREGGKGGKNSEPKAANSNAKASVSVTVGDSEKWSKSKKKRMRKLLGKLKKDQASSGAPATGAGVTPASTGVIAKGKTATATATAIPTEVTNAENTVTLSAAASAAASTNNSKLPKNSIREAFKARLAGSRFRILNEELYTTTSQNSYEKFQKCPELFEQYHEGFRHQVESWPENPVDIIVRSLTKAHCQINQNNPKNNTKSNKPRAVVVADFGCGDAQLARDLLAVKRPNKKKNKKNKSEAKNDNGSDNVFAVHSFDLVSPNELVTACDMANVPLPDQSVDVCVFCLSLMGTNLADFIREAHRVLRDNGRVKIAEVRSRIEYSHGRKKVPKGGGKTNANNSNNNNDSSNSVAAAAADSKAETKREGTLEEFTDVLEKLGFECVRTDRTNTMFLLLELKKNGKKPDADLEFSAKPCIYKRR